MKNLKLSHILSGIGITSALGGAIIYILSFYFITNSKAEQCNDKIETRVEKIEDRTNDLEKAFIEQHTDIKYIRESVREIKKKLK